MASIGIFYGSSSGVTRSVAEQLETLFEEVELIDMEEDYDDADQMLEFDVLLLGSSTWGQGDPQRDWVDALYDIENEAPDFSGKKIALFGAGDQDTHGEEFVSALGKMHEVFGNLGAEFVGFWSTEGYKYEHSLAEKEGQFCGLAIDDVNQEDLTSQRVQTWATQLKSELSLA
ncbi:MAG: flavodoxin [Epsilonproteobacteria bacterium]|nr:flavodoxin [Campylobacterota bacterium]